ncbi:MAG: glycosyltransferase family A protein [Actinomycetota bacterium]
MLVPVHDRRDFIVQAVVSACEQDSPPYEVMVVDDGSVDGSAEAVEGLAPLVRILRQEHSGRSAARNTGIRASSGDLVAFLDSDDVWLPGKLARQLAIFERYPQVGMIAGHVCVVDRENEVLPEDTRTCRRILDRLVREECSLEALVRHSGIFTSSVIVRREVLDDVGLFDPDLDGNEDFDLWLRVARKWPVAVTPWPPVVRYRVHGGGTACRDMAQGMTRLVQRHLAMRPAVSRQARALLLVRQACGHRTLGEQGQARSALVRALGSAPFTAWGAGAGRLAVGSLLPTTVARAVGEKRRRV